MLQEVAGGITAIDISGVKSTAVGKWYPPANVMSLTSTSPSGPALTMGSWNKALPKALQRGQVLQV